VDEIHAALSSSAYARPHPHDATTKRIGVVHSFTGTVDELDELLQLGLFIGINGCSLKTKENLEVARRVPLSRLMLETGTS
jgi:TatD DNase family protein